MKVLVAAPFDSRSVSTPEHVAAAFRRLGHDVEEFRHDARFLPGLVLGRVGALDRVERAAMNRRLAGAARSFRPDLLVVVQGADVEPETISAIRLDTGAAAVQWWTEYPEDFDRGLELARSGVWSGFYVTGTDAESRHHAAGASATRWLPFGCDPGLHRPAPLEPGEREAFGARIAFAGAMSPERAELLAAVADLGLAIWGSGWEALSADDRLGSCIRGGELAAADWVRVCSAATILLNVSRGFGGPPGEYGSMADAQVFEALACGACQVTDAKHDIAALFEDGKHLVLFRNAGELRRRVEALLVDPERRAAIAREGRREAILRHAWIHRAERMIQDLGIQAGLLAQEARV